MTATTKTEATFLTNNNNWSSVCNTTITTVNHTLWTYCDSDGSDSCYVNFAHFVHMMDLVSVPIIIGVGVIGNAISFLVFTCTYLRHVSSSIYLAALAVVDTLYLCVLFFSWLVNVGIQIYHRRGWCQFFVYATYVASFLSVWYVVCFTVERYLTIRFPLKRQDLCRTARAKAVVFSFAGLALVLYNFAIWTSGVRPLSELYFDKPFCQPLYRDLVTAINNADTVVTLVVPSTIIVVCNIRISIVLSRFYRSIEVSGVRSTRTANSSVSAAAVNQLPHRGRCRVVDRRRSCRTVQSNCTIYSNSSYNRLQMKVTKMLLLVSTVFLLLNIPSHAVRVYVFIRSTVDPTYLPGRLLVLVQKVIQHLFYVNFATNFLLYSACGKAFRRATYRLVWCTERRTTLWARRLRRRAKAMPAAAAAGPDIIVEPPSPQPGHTPSSDELFGGGLPLESPYN